MTTPSIASVRRRVTPYENKRVTLVKYQDVNDIMGALVKYAGIDAPDYDNISEKFWKGNVYDTAKFLFDWCKGNVRYDIEPDSKQTVKSPGAIMAQRKGDCKHYASFINGIVKSLNRKGYPIDSTFRFASYKTFNKDPHHVFAVVKDTGTGSTYWVDPVLRSFNYRKPYTSKIDKSPKNMALQRVSGIYDLDSISGRKGPKKTKQQRRTARKERRKNRPGLFKKFGAAPSRNAYLALLKLNLKQMAAKLFKKMKADPAAKTKILAKWKKLGGNPNKLQTAITIGVKRYNKHHKSKLLAGEHYTTNQYGWDDSVSGIYCPGVGVVSLNDRWNGIGIAPVVAAGTLLATALPIIKAIAPLLKGGGGGSDDVTDDGGGDSAGPAADSGELEPTASAPDTNDPGDPDEGDNEDADMATDDFGTEDEGDYEEYTGEIGAFWQSKEKRAAAKAKRQQKKANKKAAHKPTAAPVAAPVPGTPAAPGAGTNARKVKTRNVTLNFGKTPGAPKIPKITPADKRNAHTQNDKHGISDFFTDAKDWIMEHKFEVGLTAAGLFAAPLIKNALSRPKRRR
jgi:hypothetical protein